MASSSALTAAPNGTVAGSAKPAAAPSEVGWLFVTQYYTSLNNDPDKLHCYYSKRSTFLHGTEQDESAPLCFGQQQIHERISSLGFRDAKVFVSNLDSQASAQGGIIIQVLGEMANNGKEWRKFAQTFFLAEQPNGFFVLNDIFRYLKDEDEIEEEAEEIDTALTTELNEATEKGQMVPHQIEIAPGVQIDNKSIQAASTAGALPEPAGGDVAPAVQNAVDDGVFKHQEPTPAAPSDVGVSTKVSAVDPQDAQIQPKGVAQAAEVAAQPAQPAASAPAANGSAAESAPAPTPVPTGPKTWANLAASNATKWGSTVSAEARGVSSTREPASPAVSGQASRSAPNGAAPSSSRSGPVTSGHVFIKNVVVEQMPPEGLQAALEAKYGPMRECSIVASKACAFGEFASVDAARKAIQHSQDGGVRIGTNGWTVSVEEKRKAGDRPSAGAGARGGRGAAATGGAPRGAGRGGRGGAARGGRGGAPAATAGAA